MNWGFFMNISRKILLGLVLLVGIQPVVQPMTAEQPGIFYDLTDSISTAFKAVRFSIGATPYLALAGAAFWGYKRYQHAGLYSDVEAFLKNSDNEGTMTPKDDSKPPRINIGKYAQKQWKNALALWAEREGLVKDAVKAFAASYNTSDVKFIVNSTVLLEACSSEAVKIRGFLGQLEASTDFWKYLRDHAKVTPKNIKSGKPVELIEKIALHSDIFDEEFIKEVNEHVAQCQTWREVGRVVGNSLIYMPRETLLSTSNIFYKSLVKIPYAQSVLDSEYPFAVWKWHVAPCYRKATKFYWALVKRLACLEAFKRVIQMNAPEIDREIAPRNVQQRH
jgi:hypothetical protein